MSFLYRCHFSSSGTSSLTSDPLARQRCAKFERRLFHFCFTESALDLVFSFFFMVFQALSLDLESAHVSSPLVYSIGFALTRLISLSVRLVFNFAALTRLEVGSSFSEFLLLTLRVLGIPTGRVESGEDKRLVF